MVLGMTWLMPKAFLCPFLSLVKYGQGQEGDKKSTLNLSHSVWNDVKWMELMCMASRIFSEMGTCGAQRRQQEWPRSTPKKHPKIQGGITAASSTLYMRLILFLYHLPIPRPIWPICFQVSSRRFKSLGSGPVSTPSIRQVKAWLCMAMMVVGIPLTLQIENHLLLSWCFLWWLVGPAFQWCLLKKTLKRTMVVGLSTHADCFKPNYKTNDASHIYKVSLIVSQSSSTNPDWSHVLLLFVDTDLYHASI